MVYRLINHAGWWENTRRIRKSIAVSTNNNKNVPIDDATLRCATRALVLHFSSRRIFEQKRDCSQSKRVFETALSSVNIQIDEEVTSEMKLIISCVSWTYVKRKCNNSRIMRCSLRITSKLMVSLKTTMKPSLPQKRKQSSSWKSMDSCMEFAPEIERWRTGWRKHGETE